MKIVVGGQIDKEDIAAIVKKELGDYIFQEQERKLFILDMSLLK